MQNDFALIVSEETVSTISGGHIHGKIAVCAVRGGVAEIQVVWPGELDRLLEGLPVTPSMPGREAALVSIEEEAETLHAVEDAIRDEISRLTKGVPAYFLACEPMYYAGLKLMFQEHGIDLQISSKLAKELIWREGDKLRFAASIDGTTGVIYCDDRGSALIESTSEAGHLEVSSYLPRPDRVGEDYFTDWTAPTYWISDGRIYFDMAQFAGPEIAAPTKGQPDHDVVPEETYRIRAPSPVSQVVSGFCIGAFLMASAALASRLIFGY